MCLVFTVYMPLSAYVMRATDILLVGLEGHLLTYVLLTANQDDDKFNDAC